MENMVLYTAPFCPKCQLAEKTLASKGYQFTVESNTDAALALGIKVAPCLVVGESKKMYSLKDILNICNGGGNFE